MKISFFRWLKISDITILVCIKSWCFGLIWELSSLSYVVKRIEIISLLQSILLRNRVKTEPKGTIFNGCPIHHSNEGYEMKWRFITHEAEMLLVKMHAFISFFLSFSNGLFHADTWHRHLKLTINVTHMVNAVIPMNSNVHSTQCTVHTHTYHEFAYFDISESFSSCYFPTRNAFDTVDLNSMSLSLHKVLFSIASCVFFWFVPIKIPLFIRKHQQHRTQSASLNYYLLFFLQSVDHKINSPWTKPSSPNFNHLHLTFYLRLLSVGLQISILHSLPRHFECGCVCVCFYFVW